MCAKKTNVFFERRSFTAHSALPAWMDLLEFSGEAERTGSSMSAEPQLLRKPYKRRNFAPPPPAAPLHEAASTPCKIVVNVDALTEAQQAVLSALHARLAEFPCLDGGITPSAHSLDAYGMLLAWLRANLFLTGDAFELDLQQLLNIVHATGDLTAATPITLAAACVELGIADTPSASWNASNMSRLSRWRVRACMWDLRSCRSLRGYNMYADTARRAFYEGIIEHARHVGFAVHTHGHAGVLHIVREYYELQRAEAPPSSTRVMKTALDVAVHMFSLVRNALALVQARSSEALDGLAVPLRALPPRWTRVSAGLLDFVTRALPTDSIEPEHATELRALAKPYAWLFACAHSFAEQTYGLSFARGKTPAWETALVYWDV